MTAKPRLILSGESKSQKKEEETANFQQEREAAGLVQQPATSGGEGEQQEEEWCSGWMRFLHEALPERSWHEGAEHRKSGSTTHPDV